MIFLRKDIFMQECIKSVSLLEKVSRYIVLCFFVSLFVDTFSSKRDVSLRLIRTKCHSL
jgi:hypothetical protein